MHLITADTHPSRLGAVSRVAGRTITSMAEQSDLGLADILCEYHAGDQTRMARPEPTAEQTAAAEEWFARYPTPPAGRVKGWAEGARGHAHAILQTGRHTSPVITVAMADVGRELGSRFPAPEIGIWDAMIAGDGWALARAFRRAAALLDDCADPVPEDPRILAAARIANQLSRLHAGGWTLDELDLLWAECLEPLRG